MIVLGIDPGSRIAGWGMVDVMGSRVKHIDNGSLYCESEGPFAERLKYLFNEVSRLIRHYQPEVMAVERIFYHKNVASLEKLGEARGVLMASGAVAGLPVFEYTALQVKKAVTGHGAAGKDQVQQMVRRLLSLRDVAEENASDALAVAICHAHSVRALPAVGHGKSVATVKRSVQSAKASASRELLKKASFYR